MKAQTPATRRWCTRVGAATRKPSTLITRENCPTVIFLRHLFQNLRMKNRKKVAKKSTMHHVTMLDWGLHIFECLLVCACVRTHELYVRVSWCVCAFFALKHVCRNLCMHVGIHACLFMCTCFTIHLLECVYLSRLYCYRHTPLHTCARLFSESCPCSLQLPPICYGNLQHDRPRGA